MMTIFQVKLLVAAYYSARMYFASSRYEAVRFGMLATSLLIEEPLLKILLYTYLMFLISGVNRRKSHSYSRGNF